LKIKSFFLPKKVIITKNNLEKVFVYLFFNSIIFTQCKGMTKSEIEKALKLANCTEQPKQADSSTQNEKKQEKLQVITQQLPANRPNFLSRLIKWIKNLIMAGCFAFTAYKLLTKVYKLETFFLCCLLPHNLCLIFSTYS
jgi:hypothetical protein